MDHLGSLVQINARRNPDRIAAKLLGGAAITYAELERRTTRLANALLGKGLSAGDRIGLWLDDSLEYVECYFAAAKAGLVVVPINQRFKAAEARYQLERTAARALVFSGATVEHVPSTAVAGDLSLLIGVGVAPGEIAGALDYEALLASGRETPTPPPPETSPFSICFTSGTTGFPKGATLTHRSLKNIARTQVAALRLVLGSVNLQVASMSFPATFGSHIASHAYVGGTIVLMNKGAGDAEFLLRTIEQEGVNHFYLPTPMLRDFTTLCAADRRRWRALQSVLHAGSRADANLLAGLADVIGRRYVEGWGMSEISGGLAAATSPRDVLGPSGARDFFSSVGRPVPDTMVEIVDENRNPLPHDGETVGELAVSSSSLMAGYWGDEAATQRAIADGWYYSGDLGRMDENGFIYIVDRRQDLIISGGMNIYPAELERVIETMPGVLECAVIGAPHERWGQTPVAVVALSGGVSIGESEIISRFSNEMASYKKPSRVIFVDRLPRHAISNKILRTVLREQYAAS